MKKNGKSYFDISDSYINEGLAIVLLEERIWLDIEIYGKERIK